MQKFHLKLLTFLWISLCGLYVIQRVNKRKLVERLGQRRVFPNLKVFHQTGFNSSYVLTKVKISSCLSCSSLFYFATKCHRLTVKVNFSQFISQKLWGLSLTIIWIKLDGGIYVAMNWMSTFLVYILVAKIIAKVAITFLRPFCESCTFLHFSISCNHVQCGRIWLWQSS